MADQSILEEFGTRPVYLEETWHSTEGRAIREVVYGATDGLVTSIGFVIGVYGALHDAQIILITGIAGAFAGAMSMGFSAYISSKSQREFFLAEIKRERQEMEEMPEKERDEIRKIYQAKGFEGEELEMVVNRITSDPKVWLRCMMEEELGLVVESFDSPVGVGVITASSYLLPALIPLAPYALMPLVQAFWWSIAISVLLLFALGAGRTWLTKLSPWKSGFELMSIGLLSAAVGFGIGHVAAKLCAS